MALTKAERIVHDALPQSEQTTASVTSVIEGGRREVTIAAAAVATLRGTPVELVPAPGVGRVLEFVSAQVFLDYTAPAFTESADNLVVRYTNGSGVAVSQVIEMTGFITLTADSKTNGQPTIDAIVSGAGSTNQALVLHNNGDGEFGGGGGAILRVHTVYRVHDTDF